MFTFTTSYRRESMSLVTNGHAPQHRQVLRLAREVELEADVAAVAAAADLHFLVTPSRASGSQVAICGKATTTMMASTIMQKKAIEARAT